MLRRSMRSTLSAGLGRCLAVNFGCLAKIQNFVAHLMYLILPALV
jgi:hypothetical protein